MGWLAFALLSTLMFGLISTVDKIVLERYFNNRWAYPFYTGLMTSVACVILLITRIHLGLFSAVSILSLIAALMPGLVFFFSALLFTRALLHADVSTVFGLSQINPVFTLIWDTLFFGSIFLPINYLGIVIVVSGAMFLAWEQPGESLKAIRFNKVIWLVLLATLIRSVSEAFLKHAVTELLFWDAFALSRVGMILPIIYFMIKPSIRNQVVQPIKEEGMKVIWIVSVIQVVAITNLIVFTRAYSLGPLALVSATQSMAPVFILFFTHVFNLVSPGLVPTRDKTFNIPIRLLLCLGIVFGIWFLYQGQ